MASDEQDMPVPAAFGGASDEDVAAQVAAGQKAAGVGVGATAVDPSILLAHIQSLQAQFDELNREKNKQAAPVLTAAADQVADLMGRHASGISTGTPMQEDHAEGLRLAADLQEAAKSAVESGDASAFAQIGGRIHRWLERNHPGPGEHTYYAQARDRAAELGDIADAFRPPAKNVAVRGGAPAPVLSGSVVG